MINSTIGQKISRETEDLTQETISKSQNTQSNKSIHILLKCMCDNSHFRYVRSQIISNQQLSQGSNKRKIGKFTYLWDLSLRETK